MVERAERKERLEKALRGCAERGVPEATVDLWPGVWGRVEATKLQNRRAPWWRKVRPVPRTRVGWAVVALLAVLFGMGAYGATGYAYRLFQGELPGADAKVYGKQIDQEQATGGATVNVEWAYADEEFVVVGFSVEDREGERRNAGHRVELQPMLADEVLSDSASLPPHRVDLTDESGKEFDVIGGTTMVDDEGWWPWPLGNTAVFATPEGFEPAESHRFRFQMSLEEIPVFSSIEEGERGVRLEPRPPVGPFVFDFEAPVRSAPTVELDQKAEAKGVTMTLDRVVNSPARPQAVVCFTPPDDVHEWVPIAKVEPASREPLETVTLGDGCWSVPLYDRAGGRTSLTVEYMDGIPLDGAPERNISNPPVLHGPWKFNFELPEQ